MLRATSILILILILIGPPGLAWADDDPWLGPDKALHFSLSAAITGGGYAVAAALDHDRMVRVIVGVAAGVVAGVGKEVFDAVGDGDPSWKDLAWDGLGIVTGVLLAYLVDVLVSDANPGPTARVASPPDAAASAPAPGVLAARLAANASLLRAVGIRAP